MKLRHIVLAALLIGIAAVLVRSELWTVARPGDAPRALVLLDAAARRPVTVDVTLPSVPVGSQHVASGSGVLLIHYWAPWERHSREQARHLDSLRRRPECIGIRVLVACSDPFPSVTRFVARERLRLNVVIDGHGDLRRALPCPSVPYTYVIDAGGRIAMEQAGEVDWLSPETIAALVALEPKRTAPKPPGATSL